MSTEHLATDTAAYYATRTPSAPALEDVETGEVRTWQELDARVASLSGVLSSTFGIRAHDRIAVTTHNDMRFFELQFAAMRLRAILVPLNWRLAVPDLHKMVFDAGPKMLVHDEHLAALGTELAVKASIPRLTWDSAETDHDFETELRDASPVGPSRGAELGDLTHVLYTSGSTGVPKGVMLSRENMVWNMLNSRDDKQIRGLGDKMFNPMPNFHAGGLSALANPILLTGGCVAIAQRVDAAQMVRVMGDPARGMTHSTGVVTIYQMMVDDPGWEAADFSSMRYTECGGGRIPDRLATALGAKGLVLQSVYGASETGPAVTQMPREHAAAHPGSMGLAVPYTQIRLVGTDGQDVPTGEIGEVWVSGPSITPGYWGKDRARDPSFEGTWFKTGDAARVDEQGFYEAVDRFKRMYKSGGENVFPAEVEAVLINHPDVQEIAIVGVPDDRWGETGHAVVSTRDGASIDLTRLSQFADGLIARYKLPTRITVLDTLPHTATGKIDLQSLAVSYR